MPADTQATLAAWFFNRWTKALSESVWPDADDLRLVSIRNLTDLSSTDRSPANRSAVSHKLFSLPFETLKAEKDRQADVVHKAAETFVEKGTQTVVSPNLPSPLGDLLKNLFDAIPWWVWAAGIGIVVVPRLLSRSGRKEGASD